MVEWLWIQIPLQSPKKQSYEEKFKEVEHSINNNINEPFINIEYDDLNNSLI